MSRDDSAEALSRSLNGSIDQGKLSDVVLVDHSKDGLLLAHVILRLLDVLLVRRLQLTEPIVADQVCRLLFGLAIESTEGSGKTTRAEAVDIWLFCSFLLLKREFKVNNGHMIEGRNYNASLTILRSGFLS